jgi:hypothetical protein
MSSPLDDDLLAWMNLDSVLVVDERPRITIVIDSRWSEDQTRRVREAFEDEISMVHDGHVTFVPWNPIRGG